MSEQKEHGCESELPEGAEIVSALENVDAASLSSPVLKRLLEEVQQESDTADGVFDAYNRSHNRHNRGR